MKNKSKNSISILPYGYEAGNKKDQVARMFDGISHRYDLLNRLLSAGIDIRWRKQALRMLEMYTKPTQILDVATGTADLAIALADHWPDAKVIGVDISEGMLAIGRRKIQDAGLGASLELRKGDAENLSFKDGFFDAVTVAFGVRNFENLEKGLSELNRVLKPGGFLMVLEFSRPRLWPIRFALNAYFRLIMPTIGGWLSRDKAAYTYLPNSVAVFPEGKNFEIHLLKNEFVIQKTKRVSLGIASIYLASKK